MLSLQDIDIMTCEFGAVWAYAHVHRVLKLVEIIAADIPHDSDVLTWAVYLHDWGAFPNYQQDGIPHALRSRQIAETEILPLTHFDVKQSELILEAIEKHDYQDERPVDGNEALLLREADWLDMLGAIGIVREFAWGPNNLQLCYERILKHRDILQHRFTIPAAQGLAIKRIENMNLILGQILDQSFDFL